MACTTCCSVWGKIAIANNYTAKVCCKFPFHGDLCQLWKCSTGWICLKNLVLQRQVLKGNWQLSPHEQLCELSEFADLLPFCAPSTGLFLIVKRGEGCEICTAFGPCSIFVVPGRRLGKSWIRWLRMQQTVPFRVLYGGFCPSPLTSSEGSQ